MNSKCKPIDVDIAFHSLHTLIPMNYGLRKKSSSLGTTYTFCIFQLDSK